MNKKQVAQLNACQLTQLELENNMLIWQNHVTFEANVEEFNATVSDIFKYSNIQAIVLDSANDFKKKAREEMAYKSIKIRSAVQNYASDIDDVVLFASINIPEYILLNGKQQTSLSKANVIESIAREQVAHLAPYKVVLADIDDYLLSINQFKDSIPMMNEIISERKIATAQLKVLCKKVREIIKKKLRLGATQFMITAPDFYSRLLNSFELKNAATRFTEFEMVVEDKTTHAKLGGVKVSAKSDKGEMIQFSSPIGEVDFKQFEAGYWNLTFEYPGYAKLEKNTVKAELGRKLNFGVIELVKASV